MKRNVKYNGLHEKPTYEQIINYLEYGQEKIKYPNRDAMKLRNSPYFTQLDSEAGMDLHDFETRLEKDKLRKILIREHSTQTGIPIGEARAEAAVSDVGGNVAVASPAFHGDAEMEDTGDMLDDMPDLVPAEAGLPDIQQKNVKDLMERISKRFEGVLNQARGSTEPAREPARGSNDPPLTEKEKQLQIIKKQLEDLERGSNTPPSGSSEGYGPRSEDEDDIRERIKKEFLKVGEQKTSIPQIELYLFELGGRKMKSKDKKDAYLAELYKMLQIPNPKPASGTGETVETPTPKSRVKKKKD